jgi:hypothetical protein
MVEGKGKRIERDRKREGEAGSLDKASHPSSFKVAGPGCEGDLGVTSVTPLIARVD